MTRITHGERSLRRGQYAGTNSEEPYLRSSEARRERDLSIAKHRRESEAKKVIPASNLDTQTIVERATMPGHQLIKTNEQLIAGRLVFNPVIKKGGKWVVQKEKILIEPEKPMVVVGNL